MSDALPPAPEKKHPVAVVVLIAILAIVVGVVYSMRPKERPLPDMATLDLHNHHHEHGHGHAHGHSHGLDEGAVQAKIDEFDRKIALDPTNPALMSAKIHFALEQAPDAALEECHRILKKKPDDPYALEHAGTAYMLKGQFKKALYYATLLQQKGFAELGHGLSGQIHYRNGAYAEAIKEFDKVLAIAPNDTDALNGKAASQRALGGLQQN